MIKGAECTVLEDTYSVFGGCFSLFLKMPGLCSYPLWFKGTSESADIRNKSGNSAASLLSLTDVFDLHIKQNYPDPFRLTLMPLLAVDL